MAARALADRRQHNALAVCLAQRRDEIDVVGRPGAAAVAFQQQRLGTAGHQRLDLGRADAGIQRKHHDLRRALRQQCRRSLGCDRCQALARRFGEGIEGVAAQLADPRTVQQRTVEVQLHTLHLPGLQGAHGAEQIGPGVTALAAGRQHGTGEQHRYRQVEQQEGQCGGAVGQGIGAMQQQDRVAAVHRHRAADAFGHLQPVARLHVGAVQQRLQFVEGPVRQRPGLLRLLFAHAGFEAGGRQQPGGALLHADGAAGVEHQQTLDRWVHARSSLVGAAVEKIRRVGLAPAAAC